jgi:hypothetical protein
MLSVSLAPKPDLLGVPDLPQVGNHWVAHAGQNRERPQATECQKHQQDNCRAMETQLELGPVRRGTKFPHRRGCSARAANPHGLTHHARFPSTIELSFILNMGKINQPQ